MNIKSAKYGDLAYDNENLTEVQIEFRYDWAELSPKGASNKAEIFKK